MEPNFSNILPVGACEPAVGAAPKPPEGEVAAKDPKPAFGLPNVGAPPKVGCWAPKAGGLPNVGGPPNTGFANADCC